MILYLLELLFLLAALFGCFMLYRALVNSPSFTRFIENTKVTDESSLEDIEVRLEEADEAAERALAEQKEHIKKQAAAVRKLARRKKS